ncbi:MAG: hypothetical protein L0387_29565 [Acidobacteria bacterium]|nr:hypothetical protein [Acidobacteriota bacterium]MCI0625744.1 hypothetical protein [Acidobacteriota bacterium]MCI0720548.1 hypothetical protein [Acidobacteriota bacterium]
MAKAGGHVGGHLREAFEEYIEAHNHNQLPRGEWDPLFELDGEHRPIEELIDKLRYCTDIMPSSLCDDLDMQAGSTYAAGMRKIESQM